MAVLSLDDAFWWSFRNGLLHFCRDKAIKPFILYYKKKDVPPPRTEEGTCTALFFRPLVLFPYMPFRLEMPLS